MEQGISTGWLFLNTRPQVFENRLAANARSSTNCRRTSVCRRERIVIEVLEQPADDESDVRQHARRVTQPRDFLIAIDDFGTGFSNFDPRVALPPWTIVKLDRSLGRGAPASREGDDSMISHLVSMLHQSGNAGCWLKAVETDEELMILMEADVDFVQGFLARSTEEFRAGGPARRVPAADRIDVGQVRQLRTRACGPISGSVSKASLKQCWAAAETYKVQPAICARAAQKGLASARSTPCVHHRRTGRADPALGQRPPRCRRPPLRPRAALHRYPQQLVAAPGLFQACARRTGARSR